METLQSQSHIFDNITETDFGGFDLMSNLTIPLRQLGEEAAAGAAKKPMSWSTFFTIYMVIQAIIGILLFEWAWKKTKRVRECPKELNHKFYSFCRLDAHKWRRWKLYPCAITTMPTRLVLMIVTLCV